MDVALPNEFLIGLSHFFNSLWHGLEPSAFHHDLEGSPLHGVVAARLCPSGSTPTPLTMTMSAVPPPGGTAYFFHSTLVGLASVQLIPATSQPILIMHEHAKGLLC